MTRPKKKIKLFSELASLFPNGTVHFIAAVMCMTLSLAMLGAGVGDVFLSSADMDTKIVSQMTSVVVLTLLVVHPTFMLTRGKRWPRRFLRRLNLACIVGLALVTVWSAFYSLAASYLLAFGLILALAAFKIYRSRGFHKVCTRFERLWDLYNGRKTHSRPGG